MSKIQELLKDYSGTPCWMCEHRLTTGSSLFGTSEECSLEVDNWYEIFDNDYDRRGHTLEQHCKSICPSFSEGEGKYYCYG